MKNKLPQNKKAIVWLCGGHFINDIYTGVLNPIMPFIAAKIGITMAIATIILTVSHIFSSLLQPLFGYFADNIVKRSFIFWGLILSSIFIPLSALAHNPFILVLFIIFGSIGSSLFHPQALGFVSKFADKENTGKAMAVFVAMGTLGYSFGPIISSAITQFLGMPRMPLMTILGILWAFLMFAFVPKLSLSEPVISKIDFKTAFKRILTNRKLNILNVIAMLKTMIMSACFILLPFLWKNMGYKPFYIGMALFMFIFAGGIGSLISSNLEKRIGAANVFYISMISTLPLMILFILTCSSHPAVSLVIFVVMGFITMMATPVTMVMAQNVLPEYKSIISGFINGFSWGIVAIAMSLLGFIAEKFGITNVLLFVSVIPAVCSVLIKELFKESN
ncbi:MAG TPA: MFS transporter [Candidatus Stercorousia faecigallinarum]|nr:MFS transporter [Candidatus Stercorousia faecigallinarum]